MGKYVGEPDVGEPDGGKPALGEPVVGKQNRRRIYIFHACGLIPASVLFSHDRFSKRRFYTATLKCNKVHLL
jgi:uncharacterized protein YcsI (UPF0317 family)